MDKSLKNKIFLITYTIVIFFLLKNIFIFWSGMCKVFTLLMPFIYGFAIAYIVNCRLIFLKITFIKVILRMRKL